MSMSEETAIIWARGDGLEKSYREKLAKFVSENKTFGLKGAKDNQERIGILMRSELVNNFVSSCFCELLNEKSEGKSAKVANQLRVEGNEFYKKRNFVLAVKGFSLSACYAPPQSKELVLAFSNRSACFMELGEYAECLRDIENAFGVQVEDPSLENVRQKLIERKERCQAKEITTKNKCSFFELKNVNESIESAEDFVTIQDDATRGRHVIVTKNVQPGTVIIMEDPFSKVLINQYRWETRFCHHCFKKLASSVPCPNCVFAVWCGENCKNQSHHELDCHLGNPLNRLGLKRLVLLSLKTLEKVDLDNYNRGSASQGSKILGFTNGGSKYASNCYHPINCLIYHQDSLKENELLEYSVESLIIIDLLEKCTQFFDRFINPAKKAIAASILLLHQLNFPCNAHSLNKLVLKEKSQDGIRNATTVDFGAGAFALLSLINHSCDPNVTRVTLSNGKNAVVTIRGLKEGEEVLDNYGSHYAVEGISTRKKHLKNLYNFDCSCIACLYKWPMVDSMNGDSYQLLCKKCSSGMKMGDYFKKPCLITSGKCAKCKSSYDLDLITKELKTQVCLFEEAFELVLDLKPLEGIAILKQCIEYFEQNVMPPYLNVNYAQETLKQALNLLALSQ